MAMSTVGKPTRIGEVEWHRVPCLGPEVTGRDYWCDCGCGRTARPGRMFWQARAGRYAFYALDASHARRISARIGREWAEVVAEGLVSA